MNKHPRTPRFAPHHIPLFVIGLAAVLLSVGLVLTLMQKQAPASSGNIYLTQASVAADKDKEVRFDVRIAPGAHIDTVTATATYDTAKLAFKSAVYTDSPFSSQIPAVDQDSRVTVQAAKLGGQTVDNDAFVATLVFTALASGTQAIELTDGNAAKAGVATNPTVSGKTVVRPATQPAGSASQAAAEGDAADSKDSDNSIIAAASQPVVSLLTAVGVPPQTAERIAPWIGGLLLCAILVAGFIAIRTIRSRKYNNKQETPHGPTPIS